MQSLEEEGSPASLSRKRVPGSMVGRRRVETLAGYKYTDDP